MAGLLIGFDVLVRPAALQIGHEARTDTSAPLGCLLSRTGGAAVHFTAPGGIYAGGLTGAAAIPLATGAATRAVRFAWVNGEVRQCRVEGRDGAFRSGFSPIFGALHEVNIHPPRDIWQGAK
jgi:hypothetical protein